MLEGAAPPAGLDRGYDAQLRTEGMRKKQRKKCAWHALLETKCSR